MLSGFIMLQSETIPTNEYFSYTFDALIRFTGLHIFLVKENYSEKSSQKLGFLAKWGSIKLPSKQLPLKSDSRPSFTSVN